MVNLQELNEKVNHDKIVETTIRSFEKFYGGKADIESLTMKSLQKIPELKEQYEKLSSFDWLYGQTLEFTQKMDEYLSLGFFDFQFKVDDARISDVHIYTDCLYPNMIEDLTTSLKGKPFTEESIENVTDTLKDKYKELSEGLDELKIWLQSQIE